MAVACSSRCECIDCQNHGGRLHFPAAASSPGAVAAAAGLLSTAHRPPTGLSFRMDLPMASFPRGEGREVSPVPHRRLADAVFAADAALLDADAGRGAVPELGAVQELSAIGMDSSIDSDHSIFTPTRSLSRITLLAGGSRLSSPEPLPPPPPPPLPPPPPHYAGGIAPPFCCPFEPEHHGCGGLAHGLLLMGGMDSDIDLLPAPPSAGSGGPFSPDPAWCAGAGALLSPVVPSPHDGGGGRRL
jgi:hypothetical protein